MQSYQATNNTFKSQDLQEEEAAVALDLLVIALALIAQPGTPALLRQATAILGYNCAINWSSMLNVDYDAAKGGAQ